MGDLKTPYTDAAMDAPDLSGQGVTQRGGDPLIDTAGASGLQPVWPDAPYTDMPGTETTNPVSGLPTTPSRWEPSAAAEAPPSLEDRNPGTIDRR